MFRAGGQDNVASTCRHWFYQSQRCCSGKYKISGFEYSHKRETRYGRISSKTCKQICYEAKYTMKTGSLRVFFMSFF